jgi:branched-chain amino acid aminotransferase
LPLRIAPLPAAAVRDADEVFLTSTGGGILPIAKIDGRPLRHFPGPITTRLRDAYWAMHDEAAHRDEVDYK